jgi:Sec-independent protein translocase protein TatA
LSIVEILLLLVVALIVIPPDQLPEVMRTVGKILRELRLASNTVLRELSGTAEDPNYMDEHHETNPLTSPWSSPSAGSGSNEPPPPPDSAAKP